MTIIDKYITTNIHKPISVLAEDLGVSEGFVRARALILDKHTLTTYPIDKHEEVKALLHLIEIRKTGWAVDVAKARIKMLETIQSVKNFNHFCD